MQSIVVGMQHACAVTTAGAALCWGMGGDSGQLGDNAAAHRTTLVNVVGITNAVDTETLLGRPLDFLARTGWKTLLPVMMGGTDAAQAKPQPLNGR